MRQTISQMFLLCLVVLLTCACSSLSSGKAVQVKVLQDVSIRTDNSSPTAKKKGETFDVASNPVVVESPGFVSTLLIPLHSNSGIAELSLAPFENTTKCITPERPSEQMNKLLSDFNQAQMLLAERHVGEALRLADDLLVRYPSVTHLKFFKASCLVVDGRRDEAKHLLEEGLREFPDDEIGRKLYRSLQSGREARP